MSERGPHAVQGNPQILEKVLGGAAGAKLGRVSVDGAAVVEVAAAGAAAAVGTTVPVTVPPQLSETHIAGALGVGRWNTLAQVAAHGRAMAQHDLSWIAASENPAPTFPPPRIITTTA